MAFHLVTHHLSPKMKKIQLNLESQIKPLQDTSRWSLHTGGRSEIASASKSFVSSSSNLWPSSYATVFICMITNYFRIALHLSM